MSASNPTSNCKTVLFVEDEPLVRLVGSDLLNDAGYDVLEAANAGEAMQILEERGPVGLLVTDIRMPGQIDGLQLARIVHRRWPTMKLLLTSADTMLRKEEIPDAGHFLPKPYTGEHLRREVGTMLSGA